MELKFDDFLGIKSGKFDSNLFAVSIVNYNRPVSEEWHFHENFHLSAILEGGNMESRKEEDIQVTPGKLLTYKMGERHRNRFTQFPSKNLNIVLKPEYFKKYELDPDNLNYKCLVTFNSYFSIFKVYNELIINDYYSADSIHSSLKPLFLTESKISSTPKWLKKLQELVEERWDEFIPLDDLALELQVHPVTISKYFYKYNNCTLADYMRKVKIAKALNLLFHTNKSITEISFACGFSDNSHMTRLFKHYVGFKPKEISRL